MGARGSAAAVQMLLKTPLGDDKLVFKSMSASEELGRPFEFRVQALSEDGAIKPQDLLGKAARVELQLPDDSLRYFHGVVCSIGLESVVHKRFSYGLVLRPWLWLLTRRADTRVFQQKSVDEILKEVFKPFSAEYKSELKATYPKVDYCVQYRETDFNFASRLMEQEGIYYYFKHEQGKHTMVLVDAPNAHPACPVQDRFVYRDALGAMLELEAITDWRVHNEIEPGQAVLTDYDFENPDTKLESKSKASREGASEKLEFYDYPGGYASSGEGGRYAKLRIEELQARAVRVSGGGAVRALATGHTFELAEHPSEPQNARHLVVSTHLELGYSGYESGDDASYVRCRFDAMPATEHFRPQRTTPKPSVGGPHTAVVVGPSGDELYVDKHGRVKVQFHWDRLGKKDDKSSCWVRVSQPWAGKGWGAISLPRIGQEVVVDFLEGDPDRPLVTGRVYNAAQTPPYKLPDHATVSTIKSRSSKGGGDADFNELRFEDNKGKEYVWFQAQKDHYHIVKNDARGWIGNDQFHNIERDLSEEVKRDATRVVGRDVKQHVKGKSHLTVDGDRAEKIGGKHGTKVGADASLEAGATISLKSGADMHVKVGANLGVDAAANVHIKAGANVVIEGGAMITLKAGGSSIVIGPTLSITGSMVMINSGGAPGAGSGASPKAPDAPDKPEPPKKPDDPLKQ